MGFFFRLHKFCRAQLHLEKNKAVLQADVRQFATTHAECVREDARSARGVTRVHTVWQAQRLSSLRPAVPRRKKQSSRWYAKHQMAVVATAMGGAPQCWGHRSCECCMWFHLGGYSPFHTHTLMKKEAALGRHCRRIQDTAHRYPVNAPTVRTTMPYLLKSTKSDRTSTDRTFSTECGWGVNL